MDKHEIAQRIRGNLTQPGRLLALADELSPQYKVDDWVLWNGCIASVTRTPQPDDDVVDIRPIGGPVYHATRENIEPLGFDPEEILDRYRAAELVECHFDPARPGGDSTCKGEIPKMPPCDVRRKLIDDAKKDIADAS